MEQLHNSPLPSWPRISRCLLLAICLTFAVAPAIELVLSQIFPDLLSFRLKDRLITVPIVSCLALITLIFLQVTYSVKFSVRRFLLFPGCLIFLYIFFALTSSKPEIWKLQAIFSLILLLSVISIRSNDGGLERTIFNYITQSYIIFSVIIYFARLFLYDFNINSARGGLNMFAVSNVIIVWLMRVIIIDNSRMMFSHRLVFALYSVFSANRLGSLLSLILLIESRSWKQKAGLIFMSALIGVGIFSVLEIRAEDIYVVARVLQGSTFTELSLPQITNIFFSSRGSIWSDAITLIIDRPLLGYGLGAFSDYHSMQLGSAHSFLVNNIFQFGMPIGLFITIIFFTVFYPGKNNSKFFFLALLAMTVVSGGAPMVQSVGLFSVFNLLVFCLACNIRTNSYHV